jgi:predicted ATP-grasp superfamily ATP-dependent carboligase
MVNPFSSNGHSTLETGAIVIGANYGGLGIVRSLGRHKIPVVVLQDEHASAAVSRYTKRHMPWPMSTEADQLDFLKSLSETGEFDGWTVYPTTDETAALLARNAACLSQRYCLTTPSWAAMEWAYDKRLTYELAAKLGIDHPKTYRPTNREDVLSLDCTFPAILKPAIKDRVNKFTSARAWPVANREELVDQYVEASRLVDPDVIMIQELVPGGGKSQFSFVALCVDGSPLAYGVARRARQYPVDFGHGSTYVETVEQPEIEEPSRRLLKEMNYNGLVELEFKRDPSTGQFKLLDINARAWAWHSLGHRAGVDFPYLCWRLLHGEPVPETRARPGAHWVRMATDIPTVFTEIRRGTLSPGAYISSLRRPLEFAVFSADDPYPMFVEATSMLQRILKRRK